MAWKSHTGQFNDEEIGHLERMSAEALIPALLSSTPVVALRAMTEVMRNGDRQKLVLLFDNNDLSAHWQDFADDYGVTPDDMGNFVLLALKWAQHQAK